MKRGWLVNFGMLCTVALLAWAAMQVSSRDEAGQSFLSSVRPGEVGRIKLSRPNQAALELQHQERHWIITAPLRAPADEFQVLRMLTILDAKPAARLPAKNLERFDLLEPSALLTVDGIEYAFGGINTVTREQYVKRGDQVYVVDLRHGAALPAQAAALIRRGLLDADENPQAVELPGFIMHNHKGKWVVETSSPDLSQDDLQRYADLWRHAAAATVEPYDGNQSRGTLRIKTSGGKAIEFGILQREPQLLLWRRDNGLQYRFSEAASQALLSTPVNASKK